MKRASLIGVLGLAAFTAFPAGAALAAPAAPAAVQAAAPVTVHGTAGHAARVAQSLTGFSGLHAVGARFSAGAQARMLPFRSPAGSYPARQAVKAAGVRSAAAKRPAAAAYTTEWKGVKLTHRFNGLSNSDQAAVNNGLAVTPPDQGLCTGPIKVKGYRGTAVFEMVNSAMRITKPNGTPLGPDLSLATVFRDQYALGDPRCLYDSATRSFYFTEIGFPQGGPNSSLTNTTVDVAVLNSRNQVASYQFDTSMGGQCLGDQPKTGFDNGSLVVSTDEYCGPTLSNYQGAIVLEISKSQLVSEKPAIGDEVFGPVSLAGIPVTGLDPAIQTGAGVEYLVNSFAFDAAGNNNPVSSSLGLWRLKGDTLSGKVIASEPYAFPIPAASTGNGTTTGGITSEAALNPDDSRISGPVEVTRPHGDVQLWTALDAAVAPKGDPVARDGAAWFRIDTGRQRVASQGYVGAKGAYLLYPAVQPQPHGAPAMVFTVTSPAINPSSAVTTLGSGKITVVAAGAGPHLSFTDTAPYFSPRWGDYSFTAVDPSGKGVWMATEYIPPVADQNARDNWGTSVFEVSGG